MAQIVTLERGDFLVIANIGDVTDELAAAVGVLKEALGVAGVIVFSGAPELSRLRTVDSDAVAGG